MTHVKKILYIKVIVNLMKKITIFYLIKISDIKYVAILTVIIFENFY